MKIGAWVSHRIKEAASKTLDLRSNDALVDIDVLKLSEVAIPSDFEGLVRELYLHKVAAEQKLARLEAELHEVTKRQLLLSMKMLDRSC
jgi:hypothetical protein